MVKLDDHSDKKFSRWSVLTEPLIIGMEMGKYIDIIVLSDYETLRLTLLTFKTNLVS